MALTRKELEILRKEIEETTRPITFFDDDPDGLASYLLLYKKVRDGRGVVVKGSPIKPAQWRDSYEEEHYDKVFILDKPVVEQGFLDRIKIKKIWLDHHPPVEIRNVIYLNPRIHDANDYSPTSYWMYKATKHYLWIAITGMIGDYYYDDRLIERSMKEYPFLFNNKPRDIQELLYGEHPISRLVKIFSFILQGKKRDIKKNVRLLELVEDPREILEQKTSSGEKIYGYYEKINERYREMLSEALKSETDNGVIIHIFEDPLGITSSISNYLAYKYPDHLIVIGRKHRKGVNFSLRHQGIDIRPILTKAIEGLDAIGGGHEHACGASIKERDLEVFLERIKKYYNTNKYFQY